MREWDKLAPMQSKKRSIKCIHYSFYIPMAYDDISALKKAHFEAKAGMTSPIFFGFRPKYFQCVEFPVVVLLSPNFPAAAMHEISEIPELDDDFACFLTRYRTFLQTRQAFIFSIVFRYDEKKK